MDLLKKIIILAAWLPLLVDAGSSESKIQHTFIAADESRGQLLYVDESNPSNDWTLPLLGNRDLQLIREERFLASVPGGYREYEVKTGRMIKEVIVKKIKKGKNGKADNCWSMVRRADGHTYVGSRQAIYELDAADQILRKIKPSGGGFFRLLRMTKEGHFLYTSGVTNIKEADNNGKVIKDFDLADISPDAKKPYVALRMKNGHTLISTGYGVTLLELDEEWALVNEIGGKGNISGVEDTHFFAQADVLSNGNVLVSHWTGHGADDSRKAPQLIELDKRGNVVWKWHDPVRAGSLHGIIVIK